MSDTRDIPAMIGSMRDMIERARSAETARILAKWPSPDAPVTFPTPRDLPVTNYLPEAVEIAPKGSVDFVRRLAGLRGRLHWQQTYSADDLGQRFLDRYGWTLFAGPGAPVECGALLIGVLLLGPDVEYPPHQHSAEELYLPLSGTASWKIGDGAWRPVSPGGLIHNPPWQMHGMRTDRGQPLLAGVVWNAGAVEKSRLAGDRAP